MSYFVLCVEVGDMKLKITERLEALETELSGFAQAFLMNAWKTVCGKRELNVLQK